MSDPASQPQAMRDRWQLLAFGAILVLAVYRWLVLWGTDLPLDLEEAYYLHWAEQPALGYFSKPPMIAWLLAGISGLFGSGEAAIKSLSLLLHTATALVVYSIGRYLYGNAVGLASALVFMSLPIVGVLSLYSTTDAPLHFFWALTLRAFVQARDSNRLGWWLATGVAAGLGLLSKYSMGLLAPGLAAALLAAPTQRRLLLSPGLWLGVLTVLLVVAPNLWWNWQNDFISFRHTAHISQLHRDLLHPGHLAEFVLAQLLVFGPVLFVVLLLALFRRAVWRDERHRLLLLASLPILLVISVQALLAEANMNWASPAYIGLGIFVTAWLWQGRRGWLWLGLGVNLLLLSLVYHYHALADAAGVEMRRNRTPFHSRLGWRELGAELREWTEAYPAARLVSDSREVLALMAYYGAERGRPLASWNPNGVIRSQFDLEGDVARYPRESLLFLSERPLSPAVLARFGKADHLGSKRVVVYPDLVRELHGYLLQDFKGYR
jgi:4-amino-4-deoxy-L-arabinose transferase-like glycosyltransferase